MPNARLDSALFYGVDLSEADLSSSSWGGIALCGVNLREADVKDVRDWAQARTLYLSNVADLQNAPGGMIGWLTRERGAVAVTDEDWERIRDSLSTEYIPGELPTCPVYERGLGRLDTDEISRAR